MCYQGKLKHPPSPSPSLYVWFYVCTVYVCWQYWHVSVPVVYQWEKCTGTNVQSLVPLTIEQLIDNNQSTTHY